MVVVVVVVAAAVVAGALVVAAVVLGVLLAVVLPKLQLKVFHSAVLQMINSQSWVVAPIMWQPNAT